MTAWRAQIGGRVFYFELRHAQVDTFGAVSVTLWIQAENALDGDYIAIEQKKPSSFRFTFSTFLYAPRRTTSFTVAYMRADNQ